MNRFVLDTSAIIAAFFNEPGAEFVLEKGAAGILSAVIYSEILAKLSDREIPPEDTNRFLASLELTHLPFDSGQAYVAAYFRQTTRQLNFSFADRALLACAFTKKLPVLTADKAFKATMLGVEIVLIR